MAGPRRILVVEDEDMVADVVERYLRRDGYDVEVAHDGNEGLAAYRRRSPDLVVLDVMLPGI
ncbi:MAG: response regulator, partial [Dehalococcoidia bacterium]|nr:response regulator [Dehalococcoidia bacterium]